MNVPNPKSVLVVFPIFGPFFFFKFQALLFREYVPLSFFCVSTAYLFPNDVSSVDLEVSSRGMNDVEWTTLRSSAKKTLPLSREKIDAKLSSAI